MARTVRRAASLVAVLVGAACAGVSGVASYGGPSGSPRSSESPQSSGSAPAPGPAPSWIITAGGVQRLAQAGLPAPLLHADFDRAGTFVLVQHEHADGLGPHASLVFSYSSAPGLVGALRAGHVPPLVRGLRR